ncbi:MAG: phage holin family protein [Nitrospirales bacterium]|nr:phage holin family protein [Nitrospirales bacterium]
MRGFFIRFAVTGIAVFVASQLIEGIHVETFTSGIIGVFVLSFLNALVRPVLYFLSAPFIIVTFGLFIVVINAVLLQVVSWFVTGFEVNDFWSAVGGAIFISIVGTILNFFISDKGRINVAVSMNRSRNIRHIN